MSNSLATRWRSRLAVALVAAPCRPPLGATVAQAAPSAQARLAAVATKAPARKVTAIVAVQADVRGEAGQGPRRRHGGKVTSRVPLINGLAVQLPAKQAAALARDAQRHRPHAQLARARHRVVDGASSPRRYPKTTKADKLWQRGITGAGIGVAVIDTGVAGDVVDFKDADGGSRIVANVVTSPSAATAGDGFGHGTHVAGIIAGNSLNRAPKDPFYGKYVGIAPDANLIAVKASDDAGNSTVLDVINGIAFVVDHKAEFNIRVLNLSLSTDTPQSYKTDPLDAAVEYAWQKGIVVVAASGNRGTAADAVKYAPANDPYVISVGGTDENGDYGQGKRADWSSTGTHAGRLRQAGRHGPGRAHRVRPGPEQRVPELCPNCAIGGAVLQGRRHVDGGSGRRRRRGAAPAGPPDAHPRPGQGAPDGHRQAVNGAAGPARSTSSAPSSPRRTPSRRSTATCSRTT